jgi:hypothetical protein
MEERDEMPGGITILMNYFGIDAQRTYENYKAPLILLFLIICSGLHRLPSESFSCYNKI